MNNEIKEMFREEAENVAKRVCGEGECFGRFQCGHSNRVDIGLTPCGKDTVCPLARYNVTPTETSFVERLRMGIKPLESEDLFSLCACCEYGNAAIDGDYVVLNRTDEDYEKHCLDCPVHMVQECILENEAEAMMS